MSYEQLILSPGVLIISKDKCPSCEKLKMLFETISVDYKTVSISTGEEDQKLLSKIKENTKGTKFPFCYINGKYMGSYERVEHLLITEKLKHYLDYEIDF